MYRRLPVLLFLLLLGLTSCVIGTWPQPEGTSEYAADGSDPGTDEVAEEPCDGVDNDGDGSVDEGCACDDGDSRPCVVVGDTECSTGIQDCVDGIWQVCSSDGGEATSGQTPGISSLVVDPAGLVRGSSDTVTVVVEPALACDGMPPGEVVVTMSVVNPYMRLTLKASDLGDAGDEVAADGLYSVRIGNPFGPGVPAQVVTVEARALISEQWYPATATFTLEDGP